MKTDIDKQNNVKTKIRIFEPIVTTFFKINLLIERYQNVLGETNRFSTETFSKQSTFNRYNLSSACSWTFEERRQWF